MTTDGNTTTKTYTEADIERERAHAQHFKQLADEATANLKKFDGVDLDKLRTAAAEAERLKNAAALGDPAKLEERINAARAEAEEAANRRFSSKLEELENTTKAQAKDLHTLRVTSVGLSKAFEVGFLPEAKKHIERELNERCEWKDGQIVVKGEDGKPMYSKANPRELMGVEEWLQSYGAENPYLMKPQTAQGTDDGKNRKVASVSPVRWPDFSSMTPSQQQEWFAANPEGAKRFMENGFRVG